MRIVLIGANGQLGRDLERVLAGEDLASLTHQDIEVENAESCLEIMDGLHPQLIITTAAFHRVDECEKDPERAFRVNALGAMNVAMAARRLDAALLFLSTDYVFDGEKGSLYTEEDLPNPINVYGASKLAGEIAVKFICPKHFIVRSSALFGAAGSRKGWNFVDLMLKVAREKGEVSVVKDQITAPTCTLDLAQKISELIKTDDYGLYHITNSGCCSWYDFAHEIFSLAGISVRLFSASSAETQKAAKRPRFSAMTSVRLASAGLKLMRPWQEALTAYLREKGDLK